MQRTIWVAPLDPNTLAVVSDILDTIDATCRCLNKKPSVFQVFLNDLPGNDFNTIFQSLPSFYERLEIEKGSKFGPCFITGMPGSFCGRLYPTNFIHIIHFFLQFALGIIEKTKLDYFNLPYDTPKAREIEKVIEEEGSFTLQKFDMFEIGWDAGFCE
ncbi:hypothetical protein TIFTF001_006724 [Ficus carica]|uniref:Uncharacterized protein n=1 Tax=Ficus carica TaxID=3494 RepID=A0AA87ZJK0_FICCA|nr:hypothetical protein TIFTF001_006724 [Ficus carica]